MRGWTKSLCSGFLLLAIVSLLPIACGESDNDSGQINGGSGSGNAQAPDGSESGSSSSTSSGTSGSSMESGSVGSSGTASGGNSGGTGDGGATSSDGGASGSGGNPSALRDGSTADSSTIRDAGPGEGAMGDDANNGCEPEDGGAVIATISNSGPWNDTSGAHIQAHGGGLIKVCNTWYWFGEDKTLNTNGTGNFHAISVYASADLTHWEHRNKVVTAATDPILNNPNLIIERPKVIYDASTGLYVMWAHWDMESCAGASGSYCDSEAVVFTSPTVDGNYTYVKHFQPNADGSRDCTLWQEPDGSAYFISTGGPGGNAAGDFRDTEVYALSGDYMSVTQTTKIWASNTREAYAFWKYNGIYYGVSSAQTGWAPNQAGYLSSTGSISGPWNSSYTNLGTNNSTWNSQPTYVIPVVGTETTTYIYASDIWNSTDLSLSTYLWLPFTFDGTKWQLSYSAQWSINLTTGVVTAN